MPLRVWPESDLHLNRAILRACLSSVPGTPGGEATVLGGANPDSLVPAAVLIPLVEHPHGYTVLLTRRTAHLHHHAGQISFPGGRTEPHDTSPEDTALRETEEEIGLARTHVELLGQLAPYHTVTGFRVIPVVGAVTPPFALAPDSFEVADIFEVPLAFLADPRNQQRLPYTYEGRSGHYYAMDWQDYHIWGATAGMLVELIRALRASGQSEEIG